MQAISILHQGQFLDRMLNKLSLAMPDMLLTHKDGLAGNTDIGCSLGSSDYKIATVKILREVRKINSQTATLEFRRADFVSILSAEPGRSLP